MTTGRPSSVLRHLRRAASPQDGRSDGQLLEGFVARRDEAAFEALVRRHGPMVWGVCRRVLRNDADAEDAFQATFLVLVKKAASVARPAALGNWLYGVAHKTALKARAMSNVRRSRERRAAEAPRPSAPEDVWQHLQPLLDDELSRLLDKYRTAVVLCDLEGRTLKQAAGQLGCPPGTVASRLARGRALLARRLALRGVTLTGGALAAALGVNAAPACVPAPVVASTVKAAALAAAGQAVTAAAASARVAALTEGVLRIMLLNKLKWAAVLVAVTGACGAGALALRAPAAEQVRNAMPTPARQVRETTTAPAGGRGHGTQPAALLKEAKEAADAIEDKQGKAWALQAVAEAQAKAGDKEAAAQTFRDAIRAAKEIRGNNPADPDGQNYHTRCWIAVAQAEAGDVKAARETAEAIEGDSARDYALTQLARTLARAGDVKGALEIAEKVSANRKDEVLLAVAHYQVKAGKVEEAARAAEKIGGAAERAFLRVAIAGAQARAKERDAARKSLQEAMKLAQLIDAEGDGRSVVAGAVAEVQAEMGDADEARQTAGAVPPGMWKDVALVRVVTAQARAGDAKGALQTAEAVEGEYRKGEAVQAVVSAQLRSGALKAAQQTAATIPSVYWRVETLAEIAKAQARSGDRAAAALSFKKASEEAGDEGANVRDDEPGLGGLRNAALCRVAQARAEAGEVKEALAWAAKQSSPLLKTHALINVARGLALRQAEERPR